MDIITKVILFFAVIIFTYIVLHEKSIKPVKKYKRSVHVQTLLKLNHTLELISHELQSTKLPEREIDTQIIPFLEDGSSKTVIKSQEILSPTRGEIQKVFKKAVIYTMDTIAAYEKNSLHGGPAGKLD